MKKKFFAFFILISLLLSNLTNIYALSTSCEAILLFDLKTQDVLYKKNSDVKMYPASITKIMTATLALELGKLDDVITVDDKTPFEIYGSHVALEPGEKLTLKNLLYALLLPSANDAAAVIAKHYGGSIEGFVKLMNDKAVELGATNTHFVNPHGLHDDNHYTTAQDLAKITTYAMKNETFREIVKTPRYEIPATNKKEARKIITTNNLLLNTSPNYLYIDGKYVTREYEGTLGIKNGYTYEAGNCLISYVKKNGLSLVAIVLKGTGEQLYTDTHNLLNYGFNNFKIVNIVNANEFVDEISVLDDTKKIPVVTETSVNIVQAKDSTSNLTPKTTIYKNISLPIEKGDIVGKIEYFKDGKSVASTNVVSTTTVNPKSVTTNTIGNEDKSNTTKTILSISSGLVIAFIVFAIYNRIRINIIRKRKKKQRAKRRKEYLNK
ncbi:D-alanyl-D-alanine carboxypeptidase [Sedimentibacter sp. zth1]|uniref:D-alanyl-D-alanine carboxypeptidase family protein n=1 Tax=Sedimentibacter sp. zth1 TaxID=2816908 RepID=UPI001A917E3C|nr:D-alanyl-D-alanine carboxypeptidase family protein [Sedimentibacter sp. zth1]QSX06967.1 D-alanyl-D-alanine carboxypeptidase [Sedimentibacter sp. zth1]